MRRNSLLIFGILITGVGLVFLLSALFDISFWGICFPTGIILLGIWILIRPRIITDGSDLRLLIFGDVRRRGNWQVHGEEIWLLIGDVRLDFTQTEIPAGETGFQVNAFISDIRLTVPSEVGVSISSLAFLTTIRVPGTKRDTFVVPFEYRSDNYATCTQKIHLETVCFIADIRINQVERVENTRINKTTGGSNM